MVSNTLLRWRPEWQTHTLFKLNFSALLLPQTTSPYGEKEVLLSIPLFEWKMTPSLLLSLETSFMLGSGPLHLGPKLSPICCSPCCVFISSSSRNRILVSFQLASLSMVSVCRPKVLALTQECCGGERGLGDREGRERHIQKQKKQKEKKKRAWSALIISQRWYISINGL